MTGAGYSQGVNFPQKGAGGGGGGNNLYYCIRKKQNLLQGGGGGGGGGGDPGPPEFAPVCSHSTVCWIEVFESSVEVLYI